MARTLGIAKFGKAFADSALDAYRGIKDVQRRDASEKRAQEIHESGRPVREAAAARAEEDLAGIKHTREARTLAQAASDEYDKLSEPSGMLPLSAAGAEAAQPREGAVVAEPGATMPAAKSLRPEMGKHFYVAEKVAAFHRSKGRNEEATKTVTKAYNDAIAENEARFNFELLPKMQKFRESGLDLSQLKANKEFQDLEWQMFQTQLANLGHIYGLLKAGNKADAITAFNKSGVVLPGVQVTDVRVQPGPDGTPMVVAYDKDGNVAKDVQGRALARPQSWFERVWKLGQQQTIKMGAKDRLVTTTRNADGTVTATETVAPNDPDAAQDRDDKWAKVLNTARDDAHRYLKDSLGLTPNALGQVMNPENNPLFEEAAAAVEQELGKERAGGKRLDQVEGRRIAKQVLDQVRDRKAREKHGAGPRGEAPGKRSPTVADIIGGK